MNVLGGVQLEFVRHPGGKIKARSRSYADCVMDSVNISSMLP